MATYQNKVYECSRQTASVVLNEEGTEWINEFKEGIKLEPKDTIRILGSFVNESAEGDQIEITNTMNFNISYTPYIKSSTMATTDTVEDLLDVGMFGDACFGTDATGIEPPSSACPIATQTFPFGGGVTDVFTVDINDDKNYQQRSTSANIATTLGPPNITNTKSHWNLQEEKSSVFGTTIDTNRSMALFSKQSVDNELYLAQSVKKLILPVLDAVTNQMGACGPGEFDLAYGDPALAFPGGLIRTPLEPLQVNAPDTGAGRFSGAPKPGMCIATVNIAGTQGFFAPTGQGIYNNNRQGAAPYNHNTGLYGVPNLTSGVCSVIGKIIAVRPFLYVINGFQTRCFEVYVTDFVNPATVKKGFYQRTFNTANGAEAINLSTNTQPFPGATDVLCRAPCHGAGQRLNGYSNNPAFNPINGMFNKYTMQPFESDFDGGNYDGFNTFTNMKEDSFASTGLRNGRDVGTDTTEDTEYNLGLGKKYGLNFLHNGGANTIMRGSTPAHPKETTNLANSFTTFYREASTGNSLDLRFQQYISGFGGGVPNGYASFNTASGVPSYIGAYICVNENTMLDIVKNGGDLDNELYFGAAGAGQFPRIWMEWAHQNRESNYKNRHYVNNSFTTGPYSAAEVASNHYTNRFDYDMCGKPDNRNWIENTHNFGQSTVPTIPAGGDNGITIYSNQNTDDPNCVATGDPIIYSSTNGRRTWATVNAVLTSANGTPFEYCGYNNCINSTHFQQKDTGDTDLSEGAIVSGPYLTTLGGAAGNTITVTNLLADGTVLPAPNVDDSIRYGGVGNVAQKHYYHAINVVVTAPNTFQIILSSNVNTHIASEPFFICNKLGSWTDGAGVNAQPWAADLLMVKEYVSKIDVPPGYYTREQLGARINDVLHYRTSKYKLEEGQKITTGLNSGEYAVPSTVGVREENFSSEPTAITGNFVHSYIPEITFGFTPVTSVNATDLGLTASTKELTNELLTYDFDGATFYNYNTLPAYNGTTVRYVYQADTNGVNHFGKHFKIYSPPKLVLNNSISPQTHLIRLKGGGLVESNFDGTTLPAPAPPPTFRWNITDPLGPRFAGFLEPLRTQRAEAITLHGVNPAILSQGTAYVFTYRTRGVFNILNHGGAARIFCGANNISCEFNELANRFNIFNLYTPIRPHESQNSKDSSFSVDDAVPSTIINMKKTGDIDDSLTGIYISSLNAGAFNEQNWGRSWCDNYLYDVQDNTEMLKRGQTFLDALGYVESQVQSKEGFGIEVSTVCPYTFRNPLEFYGDILRGGAKITPAINGANPFANDCLNINPVQQYMIETSSEDFFAKDYPVLGTSPYYFIGSDLPINHFMGNITGTKLPVVGINARNFHSFGFSFDLGASSIEYVIDRPTTITSIKTAIYDSNLSTPTNISKFSSIIYLLTKNGYTKDLPPDQAEMAAKQIAQASIPQPLQYFQPPRALSRLQPPVFIPPQYQMAQWNGSLLNPMEDDSSDETFDS